MATTPSLNSFISPTSFNTETAVLPLYAGMLAGSTYVSPTFSGVSGAASTNPGGLFGWLIYSRTQLATPAKGFTYDEYLVYSNPSELVNELNNLGGVTACLISGLTSQGGTFGFFIANGDQINGLTNGVDFFHALTYLGYGGTLVLVGATSGFVTYETETSNNLDILLGINANSTEAQYVETNPKIIGIFGSTGQGNGNTAINFDSLFTSASLVTGNTVANRIFNVVGKNSRSVTTSTLKENSTYKTQTSLVADVGGAFVRAKNNNTLYFTIAGRTNSSVLNGEVARAIAWTNTTTKNLYKKNRVNFYTNSQLQDFLGLDVIGATAAESATYTSNERIGYSKLQIDITTNVRNILLKYVFQTNDAITRAAITSEINLYLNSIAQFLNPANTQVFCDSSNNTDYSSTINARIVIKPLVASDEFVINVTTD
jgi:hypothetical protein